MENQLPKITYLFGAGASALKLPTIKGLPERIKFIKDYFNDNYNYDNEEILKSQNFEAKAIDAKQFVLEGFDKLYDASQNHSTIDTYAKKLDLTSREREVNELIYILAIYFNLEQKLVGNDPRYDTFLISILDSSAYQFPENVKFLSWNYDLQFELAYNKLIDRTGGFLEFERFNTRTRNWEKNKFTSVKINGSCNVVSGSFGDLCVLVKNLHLSNSSKDDIDWALSYGIHKIKNGNRGFQGRVNIDFAWYKDSESLSKIAELHNETEVLVVVGYSFPFFNREVDRKIIRAMNNLKTIYIQDLYPENIVTRFLSILPDWKKRGIEIIPINSVDEFFLPPQL
jgi:hypothetical protein